MSHRNHCGDLQVWMLTLICFNSVCGLWVWVMSWYDPVGEEDSNLAGLRKHSIQPGGLEHRQTPCAQHSERWAHIHTPTHIIPFICTHYTRTEKGLNVDTNWNQNLRRIDTVTNRDATSWIYCGGDAWHRSWNFPEGWCMNANDLNQ